MPIYMSYNGSNIPGDVTEASHVAWIEVNSYQWGVGRGISSPTGGSADREASAPSVSEIVVTKPMDIASSLLLKEALQGEGQTVIFDFTKTDKGKLVVYYKVTLTNCMISGYSLSSGGDRPQESISMNFTQILTQFIPQNPDGTPGNQLNAGYNLGTATAS